MSDLYDKLHELREETKRGQDARLHDRRYSRSARAQADARSTIRFLGQLSTALGWVYRRLVRPASHVAWRGALHAFRWYRLLWALVVYRRSSDGVLLFARWRAGTMVVATLLFAWYVALPLVDLVYDAALYSLTSRNEELILFGSQELDPATGVHNIEGAEHAPWSEQDAIYLRAQSSWFNNLWTLTHRRSLYWPEYIGAAVPYGLSRCRVISYGYRWRFMWFNRFVYPLAISCVPYEEKR